jgi:hypothetical protein
MVRMPRRLALPILVLLLALASAVPAHAARRQAPAGFFGTVLSPEFQSSITDAGFTRQTGLMASSGVESLRVTFSWGGIEPQQGTYNFTLTDRIVGAAARRRIAVLANVISTPKWASSRPNDAYPNRWAPRDPQVFGAFMRQLIARYGPQGTFWAQNPTIPKTPVRQWQIWNEQRAAVFWATRPWASSYTRLLRVAYRAVHGADRGAKVVAGSLVALGGASTPWGQARELYRAHARKSFDVLSVHPFTDGTVPVKESVRRVVEIVQRTRREMRRGHDARKPIIITELSWPAARGKIPKRRLLGLETTQKGQIARLKAAYKTLVSKRRSLHLTQAYWYEWASQYDGNSPQSDVGYRFAGLVKYRRGVFSPMPVLGAFRSVAARYEGCRKGADARTCR